MAINARRFFCRFGYSTIINPFSTSPSYRNPPLLCAPSKSLLPQTVLQYQVCHFSVDTNNRISSNSNEEVLFEQNTIDVSSLQGMIKALNALRTYELHKNNVLSSDTLENHSEEIFVQGLWGMIVTGCQDDAIQEILQKYKLDAPSQITIEMVQPVMSYFQTDESSYNFFQLSFFFSQIPDLQKLISSDELVKLMKCNPLTHPKHFEQFLQDLEIINFELFPLENEIFITFFDNCRMQMNYQAANDLFIALKKKIKFHSFSLDLYCSAIDVITASSNLENLLELLYNFFMKCKEYPTEDVNNLFIKKYSDNVDYLNQKMDWILSQWYTFLNKNENKTVSNHNRILKNILELVLAYPFKVRTLSKKNVLLILKIASNIQLFPDCDANTKDLLVLLINRLFPYVYKNYPTDGFIVYQTLMVTNRLKSREKFYKFLSQVKNVQMKPQFEVCKFLDHLIFVADYEGAINFIQLATNQDVKPSSEFYEKIISFRQHLAQYTCVNN